MEWRSMVLVASGLTARRDRSSYVRLTRLPLAFSWAPYRPVGGTSSSPGPAVHVEALEKGR
jgi:hypothetical protein